MQFPYVRYSALPLLALTLLSACSYTCPSPPPPPPPSSTTIVEPSHDHY